MTENLPSNPGDMPILKTGPQHYRAASQLMAVAANTFAHGNTEGAVYLKDAALVHAKLAEIALSAHAYIVEYNPLKNLAIIKEWDRVASMTRGEVDGILTRHQP